MAREQGKKGRRLEGREGGREGPTTAKYHHIKLRTAAVCTGNEEPAHRHSDCNVQKVHSEHATADSPVTVINNHAAGVRHSLSRRLHCQSNMGPNPSTTEYCHVNADIPLQSTHGILSPTLHQRTKVGEERVPRQAEEQTATDRCSGQVIAWHMSWSK